MADKVKAQSELPRFELMLTGCFAGKSQKGRRAGLRDWRRGNDGHLILLSNYVEQLLAPAFSPRLFC